MFERFTDRARRVIVLAQEEARSLSHDHIGTEHLLLGLVHEGQGVACLVLDAMDISLPTVRAQVEEIIGRGTGAPSTIHIPITPRAKKVLELSLREALQMGHNYIGTEHILLGLIREGEGVGAQVLQRLGADLHRIRQNVIEILARDPGVTKPQTEAAGDRPPPVPLDWPRCPECSAVLLDEALGVEPRRVAGIEGEPEYTYLFLFCRMCGHILRIDREP
jgi:ATP-dependent Clp protease ATP-binding subunit ClpC